MARRASIDAGRLLQAAARSTAGQQAAAGESIGGIILSCLFVGVGDGGPGNAVIPGARPAAKKSAVFE